MVVSVSSSTIRVIALFSQNKQSICCGVFVVSWFSGVTFSLAGTYSNLDVVIGYVVAVEELLSLGISIIYLDTTSVLK